MFIQGKKSTIVDIVDQDVDQDNDMASVWSALPGHPPSLVSTREIRCKKLSLIA